MVCKPKATHSAEDLNRMANIVCEILVTEEPLGRPEQQCGTTLQVASRKLQTCATVNADLNAGAVVDFWGVVRKFEDGREIEGIDYEAHREMAEHQLKRIAERAVDEFQLQRVIIYHRIGFIAVGEPSLFLRVVSAHRGDGFRASQWIVDELKKSVPIWKRPRFKAETRHGASRSEPATA